jgi:hypothetical protein
LAEFLTTSGVTYNLERIIKEAKERLVLVSPYLKINERLRQMLEDQDRYKIDIRVVYGKNDLQPAENNWLRSMQSIRSSYCNNLHAKCFLNESEALITSMNLYEFSQVNNEEMGILVTKAEDSDLYSKIYDEANRLIRISDELRVEVQVVTPPEAAKKNKTPAKRTATAKTKKESGHCIRCAVTIPFSMDHPLCDKDYKIWAQYEDSDYGEDYCHSCGKERDTSYAKPVCLSCFKKNTSTSGSSKKTSPPWFRKKKTS